MITCPNCNHQNPEGALQCEACYTPLPAMVPCPSCGTPVQEDASFCGQCGNDLRAASAKPTTQSGASSAEVSGVPDSELKTQNFLVENPAAAAAEAVGSSAGGSTGPSLDPDVDLPDLVMPDPLIEPEPIGNEASMGLPDTEASAPPATAPPVSTPPASAPPAPPAQRPINATQLQVVSVRLRHAQTDTPIEIPRQLSVIRIGKPNDQTPPDIDVSGFPDSEVVSRVHANLRVEGDVYYLEDVGSSNGTYVNGLPLAAGNRHRLRPGDRIALGKGDKVSFIFETA